jgi:predicted Abi (CAAX) family protease
VRGTAAGLRHLLHGNWEATPQRRGRISRMELWPGDGRPTLLSPRRGAAARERPWLVGDTGLVIHAFGGIGGVDGEPTPGFTVTGHFAFGQADVERDPFTGEPRFRVLYHQIYANNPNGIVAGSQDWSAFSGDLQRGWLGTRPISDVLVRGDGPLLRELAVQAEVLAARYRSGDGTGVSTVTPATSCVQDSAQALFIALDRVRRRGGSAPAAASLKRQLEGLLTPFGTVRPDWRRNAEVLEGGGGRFERAGGPLPALLSWRSMMPRRAHDDLAALLLRHGSPAWILRTNQLPGADPRLEPLAPTLLLGQLPVVPTLVRRLADALFTGPGVRGLALGLALLGGLAALVLPAGLRSGFLRPTPWPPPGRLLRRGLGLVFMPALVEEVIFRVLLLPQPGEGTSPGSLLAWSSLGLGLFVAYHPLAGRFWYPPGRRLFRQARFLLPCTLLGVICTVAYLVSGSLWLPVLLHAAVVITWLERLGGRELLAAAETGQG